MTDEVRIAVIQFQAIFVVNIVAHEKIKMPVEVVVQECRSAVPVVIGLQQA